MNRINKLVVFDIAGTTIQDDSAVNKAFLNAFLHFGLSPTPEQINAVMGLSKPLSIKIILKGLKDTTPISEIHDQFLKNMIEHYSIDENVKEIPGASSVFNTLHELDYKVALDTGFSRDITNVILDKTGWIIQGLVDAAISSDQVKAGRPYPYMIFKLMEALDVGNVRNVTKVGDTVVDIQEGINAGCGIVAAVTSGTCSREYLQNVPGTFFIIPDVAHVPTIIENFHHV